MRWILLVLLVIPAFNVFSSRQFLKAVESQLGVLLPASNEPWCWTLVTSVNGAGLLAAWAFLIALAFSAGSQSTDASARETNSATT